MQERDRLSVAAEGATSLRIKTQEVLAKEEHLRALLASNKLKLDNLLGTRGKGIKTTEMSLPLWRHCRSLCTQKRHYPCGVITVAYAPRGGQGCS